MSVTQALLGWGGWWGRTMSWPRFQPLVCPRQGYVDKAGWAVSFELSGSTCPCPDRPVALTGPGMDHQRSFYSQEDL